MQIKSPINYLTFNSGYVLIYDTDDEGEIIKDSAFLNRYGIKTVGIKRYYYARQNDIKVDMVIVMPQRPCITSRHIAEIQDKKYKIVQVQHMDDTNPKSTVLTLSQVGIRLLH